MERLQVVIPIFNEEECVEELVRRLFAADFQFPTDFIFVDDGSKDKTVEKLIPLAKKFPQLKIIQLSRNFGHQMALTAGLDVCDGDYIAVMDGDLQDPPEVIPEMLKKLKSENLDVVYGQRTVRVKETFFKLITAKLFYRFMEKMCQTPIPKDTGDFRVFNRKVLKAFSTLREQHRFIRGMIPWLGFKSAPYFYQRDARYAGVTKFPLLSMLRFAFNATLSFSNKPLRAATYTGLFVLGLGILGGFYMLYLKLVLNQVVPGLTAILLSIVISGGMQILMFGIMGEYIGRIFEEIKRRPLYIVDQTINLEKSRQEAIFDSVASRY